jgi:hypothetical protein
MPIFSLISRHTPADCPMSNEKAKKVYLEFWDNRDRITKKHGVKILGAYVANTEHLGIFIFEAPSYETFQKCSMEPEIVALNAYSSNELIVASTMEDAMKMFKIR